MFSRNIYAFYVARLICGVADAMMYAALPIYIGEISTPKVRGTWGTGQTFSFNAGFLIINIIGNYFTIKETAYICLTLPVLFILIFIWMPETPYYYAMKGQDEKAKASLKWLLRKDNVESDFLQLKSDVQRQISETGTWRDLFTIKSNRKALLCCIFMRIAQAMAGISTFETYVQFIFDKSGSMSVSPQMSSIYFSGFLWLVMTIITFTLNSFGRRTSMMVSCLGCSMLLLCEAIYFYINEFKPDVNLRSIQWFPLAVLIVYVIFYSVGLGLLPSLMSGELFSVSIKGKGLSITNISMGIFIAVGTFTFKSLNSTIGLYAPFVVFAVCTFISFILAFFLMPETKGKTLEEIQQDLKGNVKK
ncbi:hypothetical protein GWI33_014711 [Rhynchophorus ferrugineus]|uniref:Major facilitator superfamily (MFS) profile domain-containing protein n=1 Tax=Rhynchophorus ferrugineus TaxID=354439 RepID=A0A834MC36_RHYFE|nr:hypothetical protein GWI33_014711 [Rhynchophorus ferrugineus]